MFGLKVILCVLLEILILKQFKIILKIKGKQFIYEAKACLAFLLNFMIKNKKILIAVLCFICLVLIWSCFNVKTVSDDSMDLYLDKMHACIIDNTYETSTNPMCFIYEVDKNNSYAFTSTPKIIYSCRHWPDAEIFLKKHPYVAMHLRKKIYTIDKEKTQDNEYNFVVYIGSYDNDCFQFKSREEAILYITFDAFYDKKKTNKKIKIRSLIRASYTKIFKDMKKERSKTACRGGVSNNKNML